MEAELEVGPLLNGSGVSVSAPISRPLSVETRRATLFESGASHADGVLWPPSLSTSPLKNKPLWAPVGASSIYNQNSRPQSC